MTETEMKWFRLGKLLRRNLMAGVKEATRYSYNGVVLPDIRKVYTPELQKEYPYAWMDGTHLPDTCTLYVSRSAPAVGNDVFRNILPSGGTDEGEYLVAWYDARTGCWTELVYDDIFNSKVSSLLWTNSDIFYPDSDFYYPDGTLVLAASEPIPIYE